MSVANAQLIRSTLIYVAIGFLPVAANFLLAPVYTRFMPPDEYALVGLATLFQTFLTFFLSLSLDSAFSRIYFDYERKEKLKHAVLSTLLITVVVISLLVTGILLLVGDSFFSIIFSNRIFRFTNIGYWVAINTFSNAIFLFFALLYRNEEKLKRFTLINLLYFIIPVIGTLAALIIFKTGALGAIIGRALGSILYIVILLGWYFRAHPPVFKSAYLRKALKFSIPIIPYQLMFAGFSNIDRFMLEQNFTLHDFGVYNFAVMVTGLIPVFLNALGNATNPKIFRELANNGNLESVRKYNYLVLFLSTGVICLSIAAVVPAMRLFINSEYADSYLYFGTLFLSFLPYLHYLVYNVPLFFFGKTKVFPVIAFAALLSGILFNKIAIPGLGIWAVCLSLYIIRGIQALTAFIYIVRYGYNRLPYVKHFNAVAGSICLILVYNGVLFLHTRCGLLPIEIINLFPLVCFLLLSMLIYRNELRLLTASIRHLGKRSLFSKN